MKKRRYHETAHARKARRLLQRDRRRYWLALRQAWPLRRFHVSFCCNDPETGNFLGTCSAVELCISPNEVLGYANASFDSCEVDDDFCPTGPEFEATKKGFRLGGVEFFAYGGKSWDGNWCWDSSWMGAKESARLVVHLFKLGFACEGAGGSEEWLRAIHSRDQARILRALRQAQREYAVERGR